MRALLYFFALPWWGYLLLAGGVWYVNEQTYQLRIEKNQVRAAALEAGPPELVDIAVFDRVRDLNPARELNVEAWVNSDYNSHLALTEHGRIKYERFLYLLFGKDEDGSSTEVRGALLLSEYERDKFIEQAPLHAVDLLRDGDSFNARWTYQFDGVPGAAGQFDSLVDEALQDNGLTRADNFILIDPFWGGRAAGLAQVDAEGKRSFGYKVVVFMLAFAAAKLLLKWRRAGKPAKSQQKDDGLMAGAALKPAQAQPAPSQPVLSQPWAMSQGASGAALPQGDTPLERITRRQAERQQDAAVSDARRADPAETLSQILRNKQAITVIAVVLVSLLVGVRGAGFVPVFMLLGFYILLGKVFGGLKQVTSAAVSRVAAGGVRAKPALGSGQADRRSDLSDRIRAKKAQDPFDRLAAQVRSDRGI